MSIPTPRSLLWKMACIAAALPMYIVGTIAWVTTAYGILSGAIAPGQWALQDALWGLLLCFGLFPLSILLMCAVAPAYLPVRAALILLIPVPALVIGIFLTPGSFALFYLTGVALASLFAMVALLQSWAHRTNPIRPTP